MEVHYRCLPSGELKRKDTALHCYVFDMVQSQCRERTEVCHINKYSLGNIPIRCLSISVIANSFSPVIFYTLIFVLLTLGWYIL